MVKLIVEKLLDDLDRTLDADETLQLGLAGRWVELDLTREHADELRRLLQPYLDAAHPTSPPATSAGAPGDLTPLPGFDVVQWVTNNGPATQGEVAAAMFGTDKPADNQKQKAWRALAKATKQGELVEDTTTNPHQWGPE